MSPNKYHLSVVVPVYNESGAIKKLHREICAACKSLKATYEIIFVDDGSTDESACIMKQLSPLKVITFRKNFGQTAALDAGIKHAAGKYIVTMDGDGQNNPKDISKLIAKLEKDDFDIVSGWRKNRKDKLSKKVASRMAGIVRRLLIHDGIHDSGCTLKVYKRECFEGVDLHGEIHRFIPALLIIKGFKVGELEVQHRKRTTGKTKYNWKRGVKGNLDIVAIWFWKKYAARPLHFFGSLGLILLLLSVLMLIWLIVVKVFYQLSLYRTALTELALGTFLVGLQFLIFGLFSDILSKLYYSKTQESPYTIKNIIDN